MNKQFTLVAFCFAMLCLMFQTTTTQAQQTVTTPRGSQAAEVSQTIGLTQITINYSRPSVRKRKIWGGLVPYGLQQNNGRKIPWRTGANEITTLTTTHELKIGGKTLPAGKYGIHMIVTESGKTTVIFSKNAQSWGSFFYDESDDALRADVEMADSPLHFEQLTFLFEDIKRTSAVASLYWGKKKIPFKIEVDVNKITLANIKKELTSTPAFGWQGPLGAARFCVTNNIDMPQAMKWIDQSIQRQANFQNQSFKANVLLRQGKKTEALAMIEKVKPLGSVFQLHGMGRQLIGAKMQKEALKVFEYNYKKHKNTWPVNVGMMRGYSALGNYSKALKYAKAALKNVPKGDALNTNGLKANIKKLEKKEDVN